MLIEFHADTRILTPELRSFIEQRLEKAFRRFARRVRKIKVTLWDENGPLGGIDQGVQLIVELVPTGEVVVREIAVSKFAAVARATTRARYAVRRELQRRRTLRRRSNQRRQPAHVRGSQIAAPTTSL